MDCENRSENCHDTLREHCCRKTMACEISGKGRDFEIKFEMIVGRLFGIIFRFNFPYQGWAVAVWVANLIEISRKCHEVPIKFERILEFHVLSKKLLLSSSPKFISWIFPNFLKFSSFAQRVAKNRVALRKFHISQDESSKKSQWKLPKSFLKALKIWKLQDLFRITL